MATAKGVATRRKGLSKLTQQQRLSQIAQIIEAVDDRCLAVDGPVSKTREEIRDEELIRIYRLAKGRRG